MQEPCRSCPLERQHVDFGGCRCQALALVGDPAATDPVCTFSPHHALVAQAVAEAQDADAGDGRAELVFRTIERIPAGRR